MEISYNQKMTEAYLTTYPDLLTGALPTQEQISSEISRSGITHGMIEASIIKVKHLKERVYDERIALTRDAQNGKDAELVYKFENKGPVKPKILEDGSADYYNTSVVENVTKGQVLVEKIPPTAGVPGITVKGKALHAISGKNKKLPIGKNIEHSKDGLQAYSTIDGMLSTARNRLSVLPVFEVNGDVDFSTGNIEFIGNVIVKGSIKNGFTIKSGGDVHIYGIVEGGSVDAAGSIFVKVGIRGMKKSMIQANGSISTKFIENATVSAGVDVIVEEVIMHSEVSAGNSILINKNKGLLVGGRYRAGQLIRCINVGNNLATKTDLEVGVDPALKDEFLKVSQEYKQVKDNILKSSQGIKILEEIKEKLGAIPPTKIKIYEDLVENVRVSCVREAELREEVMEFSEKLSQLKEAYIEVEENIHPGTVITIGEMSKKVNTANYKVKITLSHGDIYFSPMI